MAVTTSDAGVLVGGKIIIKMDEQIVGFANEATCSDSYGLQPIHVLGQLQPIDYVPTDARHQIDLNLMVIKNGSLIASNLEPASAGNFGYLSGSQAIGGLTGVNMGANFPSLDDTDTKQSDKTKKGSLRVLHGKIFDIEIASPLRVTNGVAQFGTVVKYKSCFFNSGTIRFNANQITVHQCTFFALDREGALVQDSVEVAGGSFKKS